MKPRRGRPIKSSIRDNLAELLFFLGPCYGYDLYKQYKKACGQVSLRSIYHHLKKGQELGIFEPSSVEKKRGNFSWGSVVERRLFSLTKKARPKGDLKIKNALEKAKNK